MRGRVTWVGLWFCAGLVVVAFAVWLLFGPNRTVSAQVPDPVLDAPTAVDDHLKCSVTVPPFKLSDKKFPLTMTLTNTSRSDVMVSRINTPFEGLIAPILSVSLNGQVIPYSGIWVHRDNERTPIYDFPVKAGETVTATVNLRKAWKFDRPGKGTLESKYVLADLYEGSTFDADPKHRRRPILLGCPRRVDFEVTP